MRDMGQSGSLAEWCNVRVGDEKNPPQTHRSALRESRRRCALALGANRGGADTWTARIGESCKVFEALNTSDGLMLTWSKVKFITSLSCASRSARVAGVTGSWIGKPRVLTENLRSLVQTCKETNLVKAPICQRHYKTSCDTRVFL